MHLHLRSDTLDGIDDGVDRPWADAGRREVQVHEVEVSLYGFAPDNERLVRDPFIPRSGWRAKTKVPDPILLLEIEKFVRDEWTAVPHGSARVL